MDPSLGRFENILEKMKEYISSTSFWKYLCIDRRMNLQKGKKKLIGAQLRPVKHIKLEELDPDSNLLIILFSVT